MILLLFSVFVKPSKIPIGEWPRILWAYSPWFLLKRPYQDKLESEPFLGKYTISTDNLVGMLTFCMHLVSNIYQEKEGLAMGSPSIANIYMEYFGEVAIETAPLKLIIWLKYIDDTFIFWLHQEDVQILLDHVSSMTFQKYWQHWLEKFNINATDSCSLIPFMFIHKYQKEREITTWQEKMLFHDHINLKMLIFVEQFVKKTD